MADMVRPIDIKRATLAALRQARVNFTDPRYLALLRRSDPEIRTRASQQMMAVEDAYQILLAARINDIRDKLTQNSAALESAINSLNKKKQGLEKLQVLLGGVSELLGALGSVVKLVL